jgi:hypothetical protein
MIQLRTLPASAIAMWILTHFCIAFAYAPSPATSSDDLAPAPTPGEPSPATSPEATVEDCTSDFCENQLADEYLLRYRINVPEGSNPITCEGCTITMQAIYDGDGWVSLAFSNDGLMIGSEAVM